MIDSLIYNNYHCNKLLEQSLPIASVFYLFHEHRTFSFKKSPTLWVVLLIQ